MTEDGEFVEIQGTGEEATYTGEELQTMLALSHKGIQEIVKLQEAAIHDAEQKANDDQIASLAEHFGGRP
jgi:ribonuclease PH